MSEPFHSSPRVMSESQTPVQDQRWPISDLHFDKFPTPATFACWKMRFKTQVCSCLQFPTEAMLWIKEVQMVDSVYDLKCYFSDSVENHAGLFTIGLRNDDIQEFYCL